MKQRKTPMRMCVGCREMKPKKELYRVVCNQENKAAFDKTSKASGRGAYICPNEQCLQKAIKSRAIERALKTEVDDSLVHQLKRELARRELQAGI